MNRKSAPNIKDAIEFNLQLKPYKQFTLDNAVPVYAIDAGAQDVVQVELVFYAGNWFEQQKNIAAATNYLLKNGTSSKIGFSVKRRV